jgi:hypothetical protein
MKNEDLETLIVGVETACGILSEYVEPGPRDAISVLDRLLVVLDNRILLSRWSGWRSDGSSWWNERQHRTICLVAHSSDSGGDGGRRIVHIRSDPVPHPLVP